MHKSRVQTTVALLLAAIYAVVGGAGESLHYMLSVDLLATRVTAGKSKHQGYYHCHGPDYHWHYHSWDVEEADAEVDEPQSLDANPTYCQQLHPHEPHACPALAMVANLKLGAGRLEVLSSGDSTRSFLARASQRLRSQSLQLRYLPRGPPRSFPA